jgi:RNA polymerase sigma factor (sigma-70 family)
VEQPAACPEFEQFYRTSMPTLVAFLVWQGARRADAADVAQETMLKAYLAWGGLRHPAAWARRVAFRAWVKGASAAELPTAEPPEPASTRLSDLDDWELQQEVLAVLATLPSRQRQVLTWSLFGYTPAELAEELGIHPDAARASLAKARRAIRHYLTAQEEQ